MGQKVHPFGFRLGVIKDWKGHWFAYGEKYRDLLEQDIKIRKYLFARYKDASVSDILIERFSDRLSITIKTAKPGAVIGRRGTEIEQVKKELEKLLNKKDIQNSVQEIRIPEIDAVLVAKSIAEKIEQRLSHRRVMKRAVQLAMRMGAKGIKVQCKGRLGGAEIARKEWYLKGRVPLQTVRADIDYGEATAYTKWGTVGIKVWIYTGEVFKKKKEEEEEA